MSCYITQWTLCEHNELFGGFITRLCRYTKISEIWVTIAVSKTQKIRVTTSRKDLIYWDGHEKFFLGFISTPCCQTNTSEFRFTKTL